MQETQVRFLVREDLTCCGGTKPMHHSYWACALEPGSCCYWAHVPWSLCSATREATAMRSPRTTTREKPAWQWRHNTAKNKYFFKKEINLPGYLKALVCPLLNHSPHHLHWENLCCEVGVFSLMCLYTFTAHVCNVYPWLYSIALRSFKLNRNNIPYAFRGNLLLLLSTWCFLEDSLTLIHKARAHSFSVAWI